MIKNDCMVFLNTHSWGEDREACVLLPKLLSKVIGSTRDKGWNCGDSSLARPKSKETKKLTVFSSSFTNQTVSVCFQTWWCIQSCTCVGVERVEAGWIGKRAAALLGWLKRVCLLKIRHLTLVWCRGITELKRELIWEFWSIRKCYRERWRRTKQLSRT